MLLYILKNYLHLIPHNWCINRLYPIILDRTNNEIAFYNTIIHKALVKSHVILWLSSRIFLSLHGPST